MRTNIQPWVTLSLALAIGLIVSATPLTAQAGRGAGPRSGAPAQDGSNAGNRGTRGAESAQARQQIQAAKKAAIDQANSMYRLAMVTARQNAKSDDAGIRAQAKSEAQLAQLNRKSAIDRANSTAKAALASLNAR